MTDTSQEGDDGPLVRRRDFWETVAHGCGWLVAVGLVVEAIVIFRDNPLWLDRIRHLSGTFLVLVGVAGEVAFGARAGKFAEAIRALSNEKVAIANERASQADAAAAEARERAAALERFTARRTIEPEKRLALISELKELLAFKTARVEYEKGDSEAWQLASEIAEVFRQAGCIGVAGCPNSFHTSPIFSAFVGTGVGVSIAPVLQAINRAGVVASPLAIPSSALVHDADLAVYVFVGPKPPVGLEAHFATLGARYADESGAD